MVEPIPLDIEPETGLSKYHRRCIDTRIDECSQTLAQAVRALSEAQAREPMDVSLHALSELLQVARSLTDLAHRMEFDRDMAERTYQNRHHAGSSEQPSQFRVPL